MSLLHKAQEILTREEQQRKSLQVQLDNKLSELFTEDANKTLNGELQELIVAKFCLEKFLTYRRCEKLNEGACTFVIYSPEKAGVKVAVSYTFDLSPSNSFQIGKGMDLMADHLRMYAHNSPSHYQIFFDDLDGLARWLAESFDERLITKTNIAKVLVDTYRKFGPDKNVQHKDQSPD